MSTVNAEVVIAAIDNILHTDPHSPARVSIIMTRLHDLRRHIEEQKSDPLQAQEEAGEAVSQLTGLRAQFIDQGWDPGNAEQMVITMMGRRSS